MSPIQTFIIVLVSICIFYGLIIWFLHKASIYFHKMDEKVGNTERAERINFYNDCFIIREDASDMKKQKAEREIKESQEIYEEDIMEALPSDN